MVGACFSLSLSLARARVCVCVFGACASRELTRAPALLLLAACVCAGELLLDRANFTVMTKYISNPNNLKLMMNLLKNPSKNIQFEAFHVFKVFVANPNKDRAILDILLKNKEKVRTNRRRRLLGKKGWGVLF